MSQPKPTPAQLETFSKHFDGLTRKHPYVTAFQDMPWDERNATLEQVQVLEREREKLASDAQRYGRRRGFAPELSLRADQLINQMEDLVCDSTGGHNNNWSKIDFLRMDGNELRWHKWYKTSEAVKRSASILFLNNHNYDEDTAPLAFEDIIADMAMKLQHGLEFRKGVMGTDKEYLVKQMTELREQHNLLTDAEFDEYFQLCVAMTGHLKGFLSAIRIHKVSKIGAILGKPDDLEYLDEEVVVERLLGDVQRDPQILLAYAVYHHHLVTVNPDFLKHQLWTMPLYIRTRTSRAVPANKYFRPHANHKHLDLLKTNEGRGQGSVQIAAPLSRGFGKVSCQPEYFKLTR